ncbi:hypothetical protein BTJ45_05887 [Bacillus mycoides]|nr:hypothetical protein BTJ45_05887 [Bacillus mycoides]
MSVSWFKGLAFSFIYVEEKVEPIFLPLFGYEGESELNI